MPTLKVISQAASDAAVLNVKVVDVTGRHVLYRQSHVRELDWPKLKESLAGQNTGTVDVKSLGERHQDAQFFVSEAGRSLRSMEQVSCALVVLSNPISFEQGEDLQTISTESKSACEVVYIRVHALREFSPMMPQPGMRGGGRRGGYNGPVQRGRQAIEIDQLASTLKPLNPKVFDVSTPDEMAKALAEIHRALF